MAFTSFRFDFEEKIEVLYCYEIHAEEAVRSKGLGKLLMQVLLLIAGRAKMQKVMLTVFKGRLHHHGPLAAYPSASTQRTRPPSASSPRR